jgi:hypothetical protein
LTLHFLCRLVLPLLFMSIFALTPIILPLVIVTPCCCRHRQLRSIQDG